MDRRNEKFDTPAVVGLLFVVILIIITNLLISCSVISEPEEPITYQYTIIKDCESCNIGFWLDKDDVMILNYKIPTRQYTGEAIAGDTINLVVRNIAGGVNNNILFPVNGSLTIELENEIIEEINLGGSNYRQVQYIFK